MGTTTKKRQPPWDPEVLAIRGEGYKPGVLAMAEAPKRLLSPGAIGGQDGEAYATVLHVGSHSYLVNGGIRSAELDALVSLYSRCVPVGHTGLGIDGQRYRVIEKARPQHVSVDFIPPCQIKDPSEDKADYDVKKQVCTKDPCNWPECLGEHCADEESETCETCHAPRGTECMINCEWSQSSNEDCDPVHEARRDVL